jgi:hypothetical protein
MFSTDSRKPMRTVEKAVWFLLGSGAVGLMQAIGGWWLDSGAGVLRTVLVLFAFGGLAAIPPMGNRWVRASSLWAGAIACTTALLFWTGPGTIWPIALAIGAGISGGAVFGGALLGSIAARLRR